MSKEVKKGEERISFDGKILVLASRWVVVLTNGIKTVNLRQSALIQILTLLLMTLLLQQITELLCASTSSFVDEILVAPASQGCCTG